MKDKGAKAVLENSIGKLVINKNARNSMCPGNIQARQILILDALSVIKKVINNMIIILLKFIWYLNIIKLHSIITRVCSIVIVIIKSVEDINKELRDINGDIRILFKKPNSLSNIKGSPALIDPVNAVKIMIPGLRKLLYGIVDVNSPTGAF